MAHRRYVFLCSCCKHVYASFWYSRLQAFMVMTHKSNALSVFALQSMVLGLCLLVECKRGRHGKGVASMWWLHGAVYNCKCSKYFWIQEVLIKWFFFYLFYFINKKVLATLLQVLFVCFTTLLSNQYKTSTVNIFGSLLIQDLWISL